MPTIWIADLRISDRTAEKLRSKHHLDPADVRAALVGVQGLRFSWHEHPDRGSRAIVETTVAARRVLVVLYPVAGAMGDTWNLGSAYPVSGPHR